MTPHLMSSVGPYPNSALSAGQLTMVAAVMLLSLAAWLILVFAAARPARRHASVATTSVPQQAPAENEVIAQRAAEVVG